MASFRPNWPTSIPEFFLAHPLQRSSLDELVARMELPARIGAERASQFLLISQNEVTLIGNWLAQYLAEDCWSDKDKAQAFYVDMGEIPPNNFDEDGFDDTEDAKDLEAGLLDNTLDLGMLDTPISENDYSVLWDGARMIAPKGYCRYETDAIRRLRKLVDQRNVCETGRDELDYLDTFWPYTLAGIAAGEVFASNPTDFLFSADFFVNMWDDGVWRLPLRRCDR